MTIVHTYPARDVIDHDTDGGDCACVPTVEAVFAEDGSNGWLITHNQIAALLFRKEATSE